MIIEVLVDLSLDFRDPLIERLEDLLPRFADNLGQATFAKPVADLRALLNQIIKVANERLQFLLLRLGRRPGRSCYGASQSARSTRHRRDRSCCAAVRFGQRP